MILSILRDITESIKNADFYSIMVDQTSDVSDKEQGAFCVLWVDENLFSYEDFLGQHEVEKTDAISIATFIKDIILRLGFDNEKLRGQCYDGCATIMEKKKYIQHLALSTHCDAHSLNSAYGDWIRNASVVSKSLDTS